MTWQEKILVMQRQGRSLEWIADRLKAGYNTVYKWSRGESEPLKIFQGKIDELLKEEEVKKDAI